MTTTSRCTASEAMSHHGSPPSPHKRGGEIQEFDFVRPFLIALSRDARIHSCQRPNRFLSDTRLVRA